MSVFFNTALMRIPSPFDIPVKEESAGGVSAGVLWVLPIFASITANASNMAVKSLDVTALPMTIAI